MIYYIGSAEKRPLSFEDALIFQNDEDTEIFLFTCDEGVSISRVLSLSKRARFFALPGRLLGETLGRREVWIGSAPPGQDGRTEGRKK